MLGKPYQTFEYEHTNLVYGVHEICTAGDKWFKLMFLILIGNATVRLFDFCDKCFNLNLGFPDVHKLRFFVEKCFITKQIRHFTDGK